MHGKKNIKLRGVKLLGKREYRDDNVTMAVKEIGLQKEVWICLARDMSCWWALAVR